VATPQQIAAYLLRYQGRYPLAALKAQLLKQGISEKEIDEGVRLSSMPPGMIPRPQSLPPQAAPSQSAAQVPAPQAAPPQPAAQAPAAGDAASPKPFPEKTAPSPAPGSASGEVFRVQVPAAAAPVSQEQAPAPAPAQSMPSQMFQAPMPQPKGIPSGRTYVLVVDDDPLIRELLVSRLEAAGYRVTCAEDAAQSVVQAEGMRLSFIISDIEMPGFGSGVDALRKLRSSTGVRKDLPVIFITGMPPAQARAIVPADDPYVRLLHKPVDWVLLRRYIFELTGADHSLE
jgi:CheY-like chemotaxis protein